MTCGDIYGRSTVYVNKENKIHYTVNVSWCSIAVLGFGHCSIIFSTARDTF